jgi:hypothetical protein
MYADDGGMRYRAGRSRVEDARRSLEAQIVQEALDNAAQDEGEEEEEIPAPDERQCRICFGGREEEETMGRLISPCLCTGSMRVRLSSLWGRSWDLAWVLGLMRPLCVWSRADRPVCARSVTPPAGRYPTLSLNTGQGMRTSADGQYNVSMPGEGRVPML